MTIINDKRGWNLRVLRHAPASGAFLQSWEWGEVQRASGRDVVRYQGNEAIAQVIEMRLPMGQRYGYIARGPIGTSAHAESDAVVALCDQRRGDLFLRVDLPRAAALASMQAWDGRDHPLRSVSDVQPSTTLITHLNASTDDLLAAMHQKTRYNIRLAEKKGVNVAIHGAVTRDHVDCAGALDVFVALTEATASRHHVSFYGRQHFEAILHHMKGEGDAPRAFLAQAVYEGDVLAMALCIDWNGTRTYLHGASSDIKKELMAPHLLHWRLMEDAKLQGLFHYDWWGIAPPGDHHQPLTGVGRFKLGFGGEMVSMPRTHDAVIHSFGYRLYRLAKRIVL
ncbi:MAG: peptidoglycan bridge formation glycyltransferase FemA/FemB family protein [Patescibacteria group bacterium]